MTHSEIIDKANEIGIYAIYTGIKADGSFGEIKEPAILSGKKLDFPIVATSTGHTAEISWNLANRLATSQTVCYI